jgi:ribonuclease P/MRP protein subunit RPP1
LSKKYDIIALRPTDETALHAACSSIETIDIISVDLSTRLPFYFKHGSIGLAIERGIFFEICYSGAIRGGSFDVSTSESMWCHGLPLPFTHSPLLLIDPSSRRQLISNAQGLVRATRGRQIILSGGASRALDLRGPHDIINLASLFAMSPDRARDALTVAPRKAIKHAGAVSLRDPVLHSLIIPI